MSLLEAHAIGKKFGGVKTLNQVTLNIKPGEIYGLIGPNGAGKTTFFNCLTGFFAPDEGGFVFDGKPLPKGMAHEVAKSGVARTFQNVRLFNEMTALENVMVGRHMRGHTGVFGALFRTPSCRQDEKEIYAKAMEQLTRVGIAHRANDIARTLSYGDQRRVEIARALATEPKLLALDEPAAGMNNKETETLRTLIADIRHRGITVLLIEHDVKLVMSLCDRVAVLNYGELICEDRPAEVQRNAKVRSAYLGEDYQTH